MNMTYADTTVYETTKEGVPSFTNIPEATDKNAKKIVVPDAPPPTTVPASATTNPATSAQQQTIEKQLQKVDDTEKQLNDQVELTQANLSQAQKNLDEARKAMDDGSYRVGNDQYINEDYIASLEAAADSARQQHSTARAAYDNYRNAHK